MALRVTVASVLAGGGHTALRDSFAQTLEQDPDLRVSRVESGLTDMNSAHAWMVQRARVLNGALFTFARVEQCVRMYTEVNRPLLREAADMLRRENADVLISTHFILSMALGFARHQVGSHTRLITAIPDYGRSPAAFRPVRSDVAPDGIIAMDESTLPSLERGHRRAGWRTHLSGFVTRPVFAAARRGSPPGTRLGTASREQVALGLSQAHPELRTWNSRLCTLIVLGGSGWTRQTLPVLEKIAGDQALVDRTNIFVLTGSDATFAAQARALFHGHPRSAVFGFLEPARLAQLLSLADVPILGSVAPATIHELLDMGVGPLWVYRYIPGTEVPHLEWLRTHRLGEYVPNAAALHATLRRHVGLDPKSVAQELFENGFLRRAQRMRQAHLFRASALPHFVHQVAEPRVPAATGLTWARATA